MVKFEGTLRRFHFWNLQEENPVVMPAPDDDEQPAPSKVLRLGRLPLNCSAQGYYNLDKPATGGDWTFRLQAQVLLPKVVFSGGDNG